MSRESRVPVAGISQDTKYELLNVDHLRDIVNSKE